jgi:hypothetical protein
LGPGVYKVHWKDRVGLTALISEFCLFETPISPNATVR